MLEHTYQNEISVSLLKEPPSKLLLVWVNNMINDYMINDSNHCFCRNQGSQMSLSHPNARAWVLLETKRTWEKTGHSLRYSPVQTQPEVQSCADSVWGTELYIQSCTDSVWGTELHILSLRYSPLQTFSEVQSFTDSSEV